MKKVEAAKCYKVELAFSIFSFDVALARSLRLWPRTEYSGVKQRAPVI